MYVCLCFLFLFFILFLILFYFFVLIYLVSVQWWCKKLVLRLISAIWSKPLSLVSFVLALNFSVILNVQVLSSVCT